jgi:hypothetical protein
MNPLNPMKFYADLKSEYPELVTRKTQAEIYKRAYQAYAGHGHGDP